MIGFNYLGKLGQLGNQMFQYAATKSIASYHGVPFIIPNHDEVVVDILGNRLRIELFDCFKLNPMNVGLVSGSDIKEEGFEVNRKFFGLDRRYNFNLVGFFQSEKYFKHIEKELREDFTWRDDVRNLCQGLIDSVGGKAISLHIRRTDHLVKPTYHPVLPLSYYEEALSKFPSDIPVLVFSDDPAWCHEQELFAGDRFLISDSGDNITDMCLMSMCQYQIMANSTYSWWGAWLSNSENVIAPKLWFGPDGQDPKDIYVDRWRYLDV